MKYIFTPVLAVTLTSVLFAHSAMAADPNAGKEVFGAQCSLCHSAAPGDNGGAQGPNLEGIFGRDSAADERFPYSQAMRDAGLNWDADTLDRFLADPVGVLPGSSMVVAIADDEQRENIIAYFEALANGSFEEESGAGPGFGGGFGPPPSNEPPPGEADWPNDHPGRVHKVDLADLPAPFASDSAVNFPVVAERPEGAELMVPEGFSAEVFTTELEAPRKMVVAPNGDIFVAETQNSRIKVMRPDSDGRAPVSIDVFAQGLQQPLGIGFYPPGDQPEWVYVAEVNRVVRYPYSVGDTVASNVPEVVVPQLSPVGGGHYTRDLVFSPDGRHMYVSVGSQSNVAEDIEKKTPEEIEAWEAERGLGAAWGTEENRASVMQFEVGNEEASARLFANGLRNCVGLTLQQETGDLWCAVNERDQLGDDLVPDYSTRVRDGDFFGWPWYYMGDNEDPRLAGHRPDLPGKVLLPDVPFTSHSGNTDIVFYPRQQSGNSAFPAEYAGQGFAVLHGSWNRAHRTGHKVVMLPIENGEPTGEYIDFLVGFIDEEAGPWGRPVAITVAQDGSLLLSDDGASVVYRISYSD